MITKDIDLAVKFLTEGELVAIPTETVYGLAANALNEDAVKKIFAAKNRPSYDPLIVHTSDLRKAALFVEEIPEQAQLLANRFWPGPLTLLLTKKNILPDLVTSGLPRVGIRIPNHPLTLDLLKDIPFPLAAPSANPFGYISPTTAQHVEQQLGNKISCILDGGECEVGIESTIVGFENNQPVVYRLGGISIDAIEQIVGPVQLKISGSNPLAPGMLDKHYSPATPLLLGNILELYRLHKSKKIKVINFKEKKAEINTNDQVVLSEDGTLENAAHNLYRILREMDAQKPELILAEEVPDTGLGKAINDRIKRAASKSKI